MRSFTKTWFVPFLSNLTPNDPILNLLQAMKDASQTRELQGLRKDVAHRAALEAELRKELRGAKIDLTSAVSRITLL